MKVIIFWANRYLIFYIYLSFQPKFTITKAWKQEISYSPKENPINFVAWSALTRGIRIELGHLSFKFLKEERNPKGQPKNYNIFNI